MHAFWGFGAAALSGLGFALIAIAYRIGHHRGVSPMAILMIVCCGGVAFFLRQSPAVSFHTVPWVVWALAIGSGVGQILSLSLVPVALRHGPLTPLWCAISLNFLPVILLAHFAWGEGTSGPQWIGVTMGAACVVISSFAQHPPQDEHRARPGARSIFLYAGLLALVLLSNSLIIVCMKYLGMVRWHAGTLNSAYGNIMLAGMYATLLLGALVYQVVTRAAYSRYLLPLGLLATFGSVGGLALLNRCVVVVPAALAFTVSGIVSLLVIALIAVFAFRERANAVWYAMMASGLAAVILVNIGGKG